MTVARLHGGPHDGQELTLPHTPQTLELSDWQGNYIADVVPAVYLLRWTASGATGADYYFFDAAECAA